MAGTVCAGVMMITSSGTDGHLSTDWKQGRPSTVFLVGLMAQTLAPKPLIKN